MVRRLAGEQGQAMTEYAIVTALILGSLTVSAFTVLGDFLRAIQRYYDAFYVILNLPIP